MFRVRSVLSKARARWRTQRGAVIVETALAIPILLTVIMGSIEFGFAWEAKSATASGVRTGVLRAASIGDQPETDMRIMQSIIGEIGADKVGQIEYIMVFNATNEPDKQAVIDGCAAGAGTSECVLYETPVLQAIATSADPGGYQAANFDLGGNVTRDAAGDINGYACTFGKLDSNWCAGRRTVLSDVEIGIAVKYSHEWFTGIIPLDAPDFDDYSVSSTFLGSGSSITPTGVSVGAGTTVAYTGGFDTAAEGSTPFGFTNGTIDDPPGSAAPKVLGPFDKGDNNASPSLTLSGLDPFHTEICISLDLHLIGGWENSGGAKDTFAINVDGDTGPENTFKSGNPPGNHDAGAQNTFGYPPNGGDFTVPIQRCIPHTGTTATIDFVGKMTANFSDEGWAISNVVVTTS